MECQYDSIRRKVKKPEIKSIVKLISELSPQIVEVIFDKIPIVNLVSYRLVCKAWKSMAFDYASTFKFGAKSFFVSLVVSFRNNPSRYNRFHIDMHYIDFDTKYANGMKFIAKYDLKDQWSHVKIANSCNELLCIMKSTVHNSCCVLNPMTNEYLELPVEVLSCDFPPCYSYGLGFSLKTKQYKVIMTVFHYKSGRYYHETTQIITLGYKNNWRTIEFMPYEICKDYHGIYLNGFIYWIAKFNENPVVCRFDVEDEKCEVFSDLPTHSINDYLVSIGVFNGRLYATLHDKRKEPYEIEIWMMQDLWIKGFVLKDIPVFRMKSLYRIRLQIIKVCENGKILCFMEPPCILFSCNPKSGRIKTLDNIGDRTWLWDVQQIEYPNLYCLSKILRGDGL